MYDYCSFSIKYKDMDQFSALSTRCHITVRFTGYSRTVSPKCGACFGLTCQHIQFGGGFQIFSKFVYPCQLGSKKLRNTNSKYTK